MWILGEGSYVAMTNAWEWLGGVMWPGDGLIHFIILWIDVGCLRSGGKRLS